ncbi:MAG: helix-turn-helix domain-containing protein [Clostridia bacterium]|nr:helix-turn-helix domain-containing protein [Clostridia bacterium]
MINFFDLSTKHTIIDVNRNKYVIPTLHPNRKMSMHDFIYMLDGEWKIGQDGEEYHVKKGDVLILSADRYHYGIEPCSVGTRTIYIHASCEPFDNDPMSGNQKISLPTCIHASSNPNVKNCFDKVLYADSCKNNLMASVYFDALLCELQSCSDDFSPNNIAENIRQTIISSSRILKNSEIAEKFNIGVKTAETIFKNAFHVSIHQYVIDTKIEHVKFYLKNFPEMKMYEIASNLGFYDEFHMSRQFKKNVGLSPSEYRKNVK